MFMVFHPVIQGAELPPILSVPSLPAIFSTDNAVRTPCPKVAKRFCGNQPTLLPATVPNASSLVIQTKQLPTAPPTTPLVQCRRRVLSRPGLREAAPRVARTQDSYTDLLVAANRECNAGDMPPPPPHPPSQTIARHPASAVLDSDTSIVNDFEIKRNAKHPTCRGDGAGEGGGAVFRRSE